MNSIFISGASDDLVEVEGSPEGVPGCDEYDFYASGKKAYVAASDGSIVSIGYALDGTGCWRVDLERKGLADFTILRKGDEDADRDEAGRSGYSDVGELVGNIEWVKFFRQRAAAVNAVEKLAKASEPQTVEGLRGLLSDLLQAMDRWGSEEDGIPQDAWVAYQAAKQALKAA